MDHKLRQVCQVFCVEGSYVSYEEITVGHINRTYKVNVRREDGTLNSYIAQSLNLVAFKDPLAVMSNIEKVTAHIQKKKPGAPALEFARTAQGNLYHFEGDVFWRLFNHLESDTYNTCEDLEIVENAGRAFGEFQTMLADFDPAQLYDIIPDFHNTRSRYRKLEADVAADPMGRVAEIREELEWLMSVKEQACQLMNLFLEGKLPLRVTHNDTKINNVLFEKGGKQALVVIDLDTVMPGLVGFDFGDAIRYAGNCVAEDSRDCCKAGVNLEVFRAFTRGFLSQTADMLTPAEVETLPLSCFVLTCEQAVRFLNDYIMGSPYFKISYEEHNLVRGRCQIAMAKDLLDKQDVLKEIVYSCINEYKK